MDYTLGTASISQTANFASTPACPASATVDVNMTSSPYLSSSYADPTVTLTVPYLADNAAN